MICVKCGNNNTMCVNDMIQIGYIAEVYECLKCGGTIEVVYDRNISLSDIKTYRYIKRTDGVEKC